MIYFAVLDKILSPATLWKFETRVFPVNFAKSLPACKLKTFSAMLFSRLKRLLNLKMAGWTYHKRLFIAWCYSTIALLVYWRLFLTFLTSRQKLRQNQAPVHRFGKTFSPGHVASTSILIFLSLHLHRWFFSISITISSTGVSASTTKDSTAIQISIFSLNSLANPILWFSRKTACWN